MQEGGWDRDSQVCDPWWSTSSKLLLEIVDHSKRLAFYFFVE